MNGALSLERFLSFPLFSLYLLSLFIIKAWNFTLLFFFVKQSMECKFPFPLICLSGRGKNLSVLMEDKVAFSADLKIVLAYISVNKKQRTCAIYQKTP